MFNFSFLVSNRILVCIMVILNFSKITVQEALSILKPFDEKWIKTYYSFLQTYIQGKKIEVSTSGTTGRRKIISVSKLQMQKSASATLNYFNLREGDSTLLSLSCDYIAGKMMLVRAIEGKLNLFLAKPCSDPSNYLSSEFDFVPLVPMQVQNIIKTGKVTQIKKLLIGGGKLNDETLHQLKKHKTQVFESFAMTETLTHFAIKQISPVYNEWFTTINGFEIDINEEGELIIKKNNITNCELKTRDLIEKKSTSEFKWLGRSDHVINSGGIKLIPEEIERKISKLISIQFVLVGVPDEKLGEKIAIVSKEPLKIELNKINNVLPRYERIQSAFVVNYFPVTQSGKIRRKELVKKLNV